MSEDGRRTTRTPTTPTRSDVGSRDGSADCRRRRRGHATRDPSVARRSARALPRAGLGRGVPRRALGAAAARRRARRAGPASTTCSPRPTSSSSSARAALRSPAFRLVKAGEQLDCRLLRGGHPVAAAPVHRRPRTRARSPRNSRRAPRSSSRALHHTGPRSPRSAASSRHELGHPAQANAYYTPRDVAGASRCTTTRTTSSSSRSRARSAGSCTSPLLELPLKDQRYSAGARRARRARPRRRSCAPATRSTCRAAGCTRRDVDDRLAAPDRRDERLHLARRAARPRSRDVRGRDRVSAVGSAGRRGAATTSSSGSRAARARRRRPAACGGSSSAARRPILEDRARQLRALDASTPETLGRAAPDGDRRSRRRRRRLDARVRGQGDRVSRRTRARRSRPRARRGRAVPAAELPGDLDEASRLVSSAGWCARGSCGVSDASSTPDVAVSGR